MFLISCLWQVYMNKGGHIAAQAIIKGCVFE